MLQYFSLVKESTFFAELPDEIIKEILSKCKVKSLKAKNIVFGEESDDTDIYFITKGAVRGYIVRNEKEINSSFLIPGQYFTNLKALYFNKLSHVTFETVMPTVLLYITGQHFLEMAVKYPRLNVLFMKILAAAIINHEERLLMLLGFDAKEKYMLFLERFGEYSNYLPQKDIASYLSIAPETLSRVRKEIAEKTGEQDY